MTRSPIWYLFWSIRAAEFGKLSHTSKNRRRSPAAVRRLRRLKKLSIIPHELSQNSRSVTGAFFDYDDALALRQMALTAGVGMPHYLLAPEVSQLLPYLRDLTQRLFGETLWNTRARLNECLALKPSDFVLDNGTRPFVVIKTLKQRTRGRPEAGEQLRRIVPLFDEAYVHRLREYFRTFRPKKHELESH